MEPVELRVRSSALYLTAHDLVAAGWHEVHRHSAGIWSAAPVEVATWIDETRARFVAESLLCAGQRVSPTGDGVVVEGALDEVRTASLTVEIDRTDSRRTRPRVGSAWRPRTPRPSSSIPPATLERISTISDAG